MITISFDPGETTGVAVFDDDKVYSWDQIPMDKILDFLSDEPKPDVVIYENFQLLPHKAKALIGSKFETIQVIGMIKAYAHRHGAELIEQRPGIKSIAEMWTGVKPPKNHKQSHKVDAYNHGAYYLCRIGVMKTELEKSFEVKE